MCSSDLPYPLGYARRAFRAPGHRLAAAHAAHWLWQAWHTTRDYPQPASWFAVHAGLLNPWESQGLGLLLGQAISDGDEEVYQILRDTAGTQHPVARMGRHVPLALLSSTREDAWTLAEGLLLAAQRQEGLRQVILETVDEASVDAFTRTLRLILGEDLLRFAATLRAACVWFGLNYDVTDLKVVRAHLSRALTFLDDPQAAREAVQGGEGVDAYLALFTLGMRDAVQAAGLARFGLSGSNDEFAGPLVKGRGEGQLAGLARGADAELHFRKHGGGQVGGVGVEALAVEVVRRAVHPAGDDGSGHDEERKRQNDFEQSRGAEPRDRERTEPHFAPSAAASVAGAGGAVSVVESPSN